MLREPVSLFEIASSDPCMLWAPTTAFPSMELWRMRDTCFRSGHFVSVNDLWTSGPSHPQPCRFERTQRVHLESLCQFVPNRRAAAKWPLPDRKTPIFNGICSKNPKFNQIKPQDIATAHLRAATVPQASNGRFIVSQGQIGSQQISALLRHNLQALASRTREGTPSTSSLPANAYGADSPPTEQVLGAELRSAADTFVDLGERLLAVGARRSRGLEAVVIMFAVGSCGMSGAGSERLLFKPRYLEPH